MIELVLVSQFIILIILVVILVISKKQLDSRSLTITSLVDLLYEIDNYKEYYKYQSEVDQLTGVLNKVTMIELCDLELSSNSLKSGSLIITDIDNFKQINDSRGHNYGDMVLVKFSILLKHVFRKDDYISRFGGDEFVILVKNVNKDVIKDKLDYLIKESPGISLDIELSISVGVSMIPDDGNSYQELFKKADRALYSVKRTTKNSYSFYNR